MNLSYWEKKSGFTNIDFTIIGSGIVGLSTALNLKKLYPKSKILILEKGILPNGASTKNAGFACFGSLSEIINDLQSHSENEVFSIVEQRWKGLQLLRKELGDKKLGYKHFGGYEIFNNQETFDDCKNQKNKINKLLKPLFKENVFKFKKNTFGFKNVIHQFAFNQLEGQINTGKMMQNLTLKALKKGIRIINSTEVTKIEDQTQFAEIEIKDNFTFKTKKVCIATNGFANQFLKLDLKPARAQVLITKPIKNLNIKGTFHLEKGYYYFRNINNRILFGGGRNLDFKIEETTEFGLTSIIQNKLDELLKNTILPNTAVEIDQRWSGIMGVGQQKRALVNQLSKNIYYGVRLGGMGIAIGSLIGKRLANLTKK